jgi:hypothetical protein
MLIARGGTSPTALLLGVETSHDVNALTAAQLDRYRTQATTQAPSTGHTRAKAKAVMRSCA